MSDYTECPNGCGVMVKADWIHPGGTWDGPEEMRPHAVPRSGDYHLAYDCPGSFDSWCAALGGVVGMGQAIAGRI